jgi:diguanylate cyclase (GGDEF)-like protein
VAFVDVDGLKPINDAEDHAAGDLTIQQVAGALRSTLRAYDLVIRYGGDEFVCAMCAMSGVSLAAAEERMAQVVIALDDGAPRRSVSVGPAQLEQQDTLDSVIARADAALYAARSQQAGRPRL